MKGEAICFSTLDELPEEAALDREGFVAVGTKSNVTFPLVVSGRVVGAMTFAAVRHSRQWPPEVINRLRLVGQVFASALARKRAEAELRRTLEENARLRERLSEENVYLRQEVNARGAHGQRRDHGRSAGDTRSVLDQVDAGGADRAPRCCCSARPARARS